MSFSSSSSSFFFLFLLFWPAIETRIEHDDWAEDWIDLSITLIAKKGGRVDRKDRNSNTMLIKGKGLFPARGHEWEFVTHVDHNESSLRGHNVEPRVLYSPSPSPSRFSRATFPRIRRVHEQEETFLSPVGEMRFPRWARLSSSDPLRSRNGSYYPLFGGWGSRHLSRFADY